VNWLTEQWNGLPKWAWVSIAGVGSGLLIYLYRQHKRAQAAAAGSSSGAFGATGLGEQGSAYPGAGLLSPILLGGLEPSGAISPVGAATPSAGPTPAPGTAALGQTFYGSTWGPASPSGGKITPDAEGSYTPSQMAALQAPIPGVGGGLFSWIANPAEAQLIGGQQYYEIAPGQFIPATQGVPGGTGALFYRVPGT
jgi:hypothetical protein